MLNGVQKTILLVVVLLLSIPFIEMLDGNGEMKWTSFDFLIAFVLLASFGFILEKVIRSIKSTGIRVAVLGLLILMFVLFWAELAVGIFNSPMAGD